MIRSATKSCGVLAYCDVSNVLFACPEIRYNVANEHKKELLMNLKIANRLLAYRRAHGYSQEDLAEKIGVSRQAVSKWERAEAAPDTDNLIALAALYGVLIDELINGEGEPKLRYEESPAQDETEQQKAPEETPDEDETEQQARQGKTKVQFTDRSFKIDDGDDMVYIGPKGVHIVEKNSDQVHIDENGVRIVEDGVERTQDKINIKGNFELEFDSGPLWPVTAVLCTIAYLVMGFCLPRGWACGWTVFFLVPVIPSLVTAIARRRPTEFLFPVFVAGLYLVAGMCYSRWHPEWIIFLTIPIYYIIAEAIEGRRKRKTKR